MADDGLLLNFSIGEEPLSTKTSLKGGPWRARRRVQKQRTHHSRREAQPEQEEFDSRPPKKIRVDNGPEWQTSKSSKNSTPATSNRAQPSQKQIISSLFSYNPASTTTPKETPAIEEEKVDQPSNAPLSEELNGLTSLGISPTIATHLVNKLNVTAPTAIQKEAVPTLIHNDTDAFIQAETGSGKTLAYLLPIVQRIMALTTESGPEGSKNTINRQSGLFAIIMAPTRELSKQIYVVLENLLRCAHWIVPGIVIGGEKKSREKARLRKGMNILVATPGRLVDHLANTEVLNVGNVRWLVLDEGDRLMELGFEDDIKKIVDKLDSQKGPGRGIEGLPDDRTNVLCSATMKMDVQRLGEISLKEAVHIRLDTSQSTDIEERDHKFSAPAQLKQTYAIVPAKLRLVTLVAMLKRAFSRRGSVMKVIVFMSCADSVDFHYEIFTRTDAPAVDCDNADQKDPKHTHPKANEKRPRHGKQPDTASSSSSEPITFGHSPVVSSPTNSAKAYRLHGSLPQAIRTKTINAFSKDTEPAFLICTDVISRGLDLPIDLVIEFDPSCSKEEHLHRIGRTARAGRDGRAAIFLMPGSEEGYVSILKEGRRDGVSGLTRHTAEEILRKGFTATVDGKEQMAGWDVRATDWELEIERWALSDPRILEMARRAFQSHVRAYATHVAAEREMFNIKDLHLGHLAKAFGLRDRPGSINVPGLRQNPEQVRDEREKHRREQRTDSAKGEPNRNGPHFANTDKDLDLSIGDEAQEEAARKMRMKMRMKMKMQKMAGGADEFNLA